MNRRTFLKTSAAAVSALAVPPRVMAGPFTAGDWAELIPPDKKLRPEWVASLFARGEPAVYTKSRRELDYIGMPVGGICCGTVYLGGDGKLWLWDIFNENKEGILGRTVPWSETGFSFAGKGAIGPRDGSAYVKPHRQASPFEQGFALAIRQSGVEQVRALDQAGWAEVKFHGTYPIGTVEYSDPDSPVTASLVAYSPFIPLNADDSGLPAIVVEVTVKNTSAAEAEVEASGWLENACLLRSAQPGEGQRSHRVVRGPTGALTIESSFETAKPPPDSEKRPDILVEDFESGTYARWQVEGDAFGKAPVQRAQVPTYQGDLGGEGRHMANSHASAPGEGVGAKDARTGRLVSKPFRLERNHLAFSIGGGSNASEVGVRLVVDGKVVRSATGHNGNRMRREAFDVRGLAGKDAVLEVYDQGTGGWGNIGIDHIVQTDTPPVQVPLEKRRDFGTMAFSVLEGGASEAGRRDGEKLIGKLTRKLELKPGESRTTTFVIAWRFPNTALPVRDASGGNHYASRFPSAGAVAAYAAREYPRLSRLTKLWRDTWYDSTLPHWLLDRTFANTSTLATTTCHRFASGRFWAWEGIGCCEGTCTHVWHYAQAVGRIFPEIERDQRERVDFGAGFDEASGIVRHRGEDTGPAIDGQAGRILGVLREHQMSPDDKFLRRIWPRVKRAIEHLLAHDSDQDGLIDGAQENTLDAAWYGQISWISSLAAAALRAGEVMALDLGDSDFADRCRKRFEKARAAIETRLWNGEHFIHLPEKGRESNLGTYQGCHIDQAHGQSWAWQVGLGRILDSGKTQSALKALFKHNFAPDVGPFRARNREGRPYALAGDAGLIMASNPRGLEKPYGDAAQWQYGYFNECMSGFEHQAASHMVAEGLLLEGLAVTRAVHDRYHASRRNPYNEVECSDHYARAMASYGTFITLCGFEHHGPSGRIAFAPRLAPERFKAAFTAAEGWGSYEQSIENGAFRARIEVKHGKLRLKSLGVAHAFPSPPKVAAAGREAPCRLILSNGRSVLELEEPIVIHEGTALVVG